MKINRHNYETFFLMYADNELSASEKATVEQFVQQNPDLKEELSMIMDTILPLEEIRYSGKESLFKTGIEEGIQEKLLLNLDGELSADEKASLEKQLLADKQLQEEWNILKATKLDAAEKIVFENKSVLYRRERDNVIVMRFVKYAIAAALIGMGFYLGISLMHANKVIAPVDVAVTKPGTTVIDKGESNSLAKVDKANETNEKTGVQVKDENNVAAVLIAKVKDNKVSDSKIKDKEPVSTNEANIVRVLPKQQNKIPENLINIKEEQIASLITKEKPVTITDVQDKNIMPLQGNDNARLAMLDANDANADNRILFMEEDKVTRSKAGGFLRKLKRTVERNTKIKTGDDIKIAGFSFAIK